MRGREYHGLVYSVTDDKGNKVGNPFKSSLFGKSAGYEAVQRKFIRSKSEIKDRKLADMTKRTVLSVLQGTYDKDKFVSHPELSSYFDTVLTSEDFTRSKPDPEGYLKGAERLGFDPSECVGFEDSVNGLKSLNAAKVFTVGLDTTNPCEVVAEYADIVVSDFATPEAIIALFEA